MKTIKKNISDLKAPERNMRIHTKKQIEEFIRSIHMFGQIRPVVVDENNVILAGNGLVEALQTMGEIQADTLVMKNLSENQKKKLMIADNKIFNLGIENLETLNAFLEDLHEDLDIPGFDEEILKAMVADGEEITQKISEYGTLDEDEIKVIQESGERKAVKMQQVTPEQTISEHRLSEEATPEQVECEQEVKPNTFPEENELTEIRKFVSCPKCGEKIWL